MKIICVFSATFRDGRSKVSRSIVHTTEPNKNRRAPDKNRTDWYTRIISRSHGDKVSENPIVEGNYQRDINSPNFRSSSQSNNTGAAIKFGFWFVQTMQKICFFKIRCSCFLQWKNSCLPWLHEIGIDWHTLIWNYLRFVVNYVIERHHAKMQRVR